MAGLSEVWAVFVVFVLFGAARAFARPSSQASTPNLVPRSAILNANATNFSSGLIVTIGGAALICCFDVAGATI